MQYCEQQLAIAAFEPWNAASNLAFVVAAIGIWGETHWRRWPLRPGSLCLLGLAGAIGGGSFAWHATHAPWAELADVIPILLFVLCFLFIVARDCYRVSSGRAVAVCAAMLGSIVGLTAVLPRVLNGSISYVPVWGGLLALAFTVPSRATRRLLAAAAVLFTVALTARTIDLAVCGRYPHGSHWLWHLCNGVVIYLAMRATLHEPAAHVVV